MGGEDVDLAILRLWTFLGMVFQRLSDLQLRDKKVRGAGLKHFLFSPQFGEDSQFD